MEVVDAVCEVWGADRVGVHLAPRGDAHDMKDSNPKELFSYVARELGKKKIAFILAREYQGADSIGKIIKDNFGGVFIANEKFTKETAEKAISNKEADAVSFGILFISNPDLPKRFLENAPLNETNFQTIYAEGKTGYSDYPALG
jgi:2,4-dienoyl-CoA reductase-like NADH-dependent reductase (Old Yellow Enzyme family)